MLERLRRAEQRRSACACRRVDDLQAAPQRVVTVVHGTFSAHAKWMQPDSPLMSSIERGGGTLVRRFCWSGTNGHRARLVAGSELAHQLDGDIRKWPHADHVVVAHSHGGNVALYALDSKRSSGLEKVRLVSLSTPYLHITRRGLQPVGFAVGFMMFILVGYLIDDFWPGSITNEDSRFLAEIDAPGEATLLGLRGGWVTTIALGILVAVPALLLWSRRQLQSVGVLQPTLHPEESSQDATGLALPSLGTDRVTALRTPGDEASGTLIMSQVIAWVVHVGLIVAYVITGLVLAALLLIVVIGLAAGLISAVSPVPSYDWYQAAATSPVIDWPTNLLVGDFLTVTFAAAPIFGLASLLVSAPFGLDATFLSLRARQNAESAPPGGANVVYVATNPTSGWLRHSVLYDHDEGITAIRQAVRRTDIGD